MKAVLNALCGSLAAGRAVALGRVIEVIGSGVRPAGAAIAVTEAGEVVGSASGGCVEGAVVEEARRALARPSPPYIRTFGCSDDEAFDIGLTCGGTIRVLVERLAPGAQAAGRGGEADLDWLWQLSSVLSAGTGAALVEVVEGPAGLLGWKALLATPEGQQSLATGPPERAPALMQGLWPQVAADVSADLAAEQSASHAYDLGPAGAEKLTVFVDSFPARPRMVIIGAASFTDALSAQAKLLGYYVVVCDARTVFASSARFPHADEVVAEWPDRYLSRAGAGLGPRDALCVLTHDPKFDVPAVIAALATSVGYIGVMGSRRSQAHRRERLAESGVGEEAMARLHGPLGLDLGAMNPEETAVSIMGEIIAARRGRAGGPLGASDGPIHPLEAPAVAGSRMARAQATLWDGTA